jgi:hypothetical protein
MEVRFPMTESTYAHAGTEWREGWARTILVGAAAGIVASIVMGIFAMVAAATYQETGFFTPLYHIASPLIGGDPMMGSMEAAAQGEAFTFDAGPALLGLAIHMIVGALWGVLFFVLVRAIGLRGAAPLVIAGIVFGLVVMLFMSFVTLPLTAAIVGGGKPIEEMPSMVGWGTFSVEHAIFGLVVGVWAAARRSATARAETLREEGRLAA